MNSANSWVTSDVLGLWGGGGASSGPAKPPPEPGSPQLTEYWGDQYGSIVPKIERTTTCHSDHSSITRFGVVVQGDGRGWEVCPPSGCSQLSLQPSLGGAGRPPCGQCRRGAVPGGPTLACIASGGLGSGRYHQTTRTRILDNPCPCKSPMLDQGCPQ